MNQAIHTNLAGGKWFILSLSQQMGNIGSEVGRAILWQKKNNVEQRDKALERALELFDLTLEDVRWKKRLKEIARAREVLTDFFHGDNIYKTNAQNLEKYFYYFAYAARKDK